MLEKERVYNEKIAPLLERVYEICEENDIQMVASFYVGDIEEGEVIYNTYLNSSENSSTLEDSFRVVEFDYEIISREIFNLLMKM